MGDAVKMPDDAKNAAATNSLLADYSVLLKERIDACSPLSWRVWFTAMNNLLLRVLRAETQRRVRTVLLHAASQ
jgi:hypothetical protein